MVKIVKKIFIIISFFLIENRMFALSWKHIAHNKHLKLYIGNIPTDDQRDKFYLDYIGLSLTRNNSNHIMHDVNNPFPLQECSVDVVQSEDVFEHIEYSNLTAIIDEIYRVLKYGGYFRLSMPDYGCDILYDRSQKNFAGEPIFDPVGGGYFLNGKIFGGGHVWFPTYAKVKKLLNNTLFSSRGMITYYHYYDESGNSVTHPIDYSKGFVLRTPDHDKRVQNPYRAMSIVIDMYK